MTKTYLKSSIYEFMKHQKYPKLNKQTQTYHLIPLSSGYCDELHTNINGTWKYLFGCKDCKKKRKKSKGKCHKCEFKAKYVEDEVTHIEHMRDITRLRTTEQHKILADVTREEVVLSTRVKNISAFLSLMKYLDFKPSEMALFQEAKRLAKNDVELAKQKAKAPTPPPSPKSPPPRPPATWEEKYNGLYDVLQHHLLKVNEHKVGTVAWKRAFKNYTLACCYLLEPEECRRLVYWSVEVCSELNEKKLKKDTKTNYLFISDISSLYDHDKKTIDAVKMEFVLNDHKSSAYHGTQRREVSGDLKKVLATYIRGTRYAHEWETSVTNPIALFTDCSGKPFTKSNSFGTYLRRHVFSCYDKDLLRDDKSKNLGVQKLRKIVVNGCPEIAQRNAKLQQLLDESELDAEKRGHTCMTELIHYYLR
jgi:hypothetical protein